MKLTDLQKEKYFRLLALGWLLSDDFKDRGTGRTTVLLHVLIRRALLTGRPVRLWDHREGTPFRVLADYVERIMREDYPNYNVMFDLHGRTIVVTPKEQQQQQQPTLQIGDVVRLKSGGPAMTVAEIDGSEVVVRWFEGSDLNSGRIGATLLTTQ